MIDPDEPLMITLPSGARVTLTEADQLAKPGPTRAAIRRWRKEAKPPIGHALPTSEKQRRQKEREARERREKRRNKAV